MVRLRDYSLPFFQIPSLWTIAMPFPHKDIRFGTPADCCCCCLTCCWYRPLRSGLAASLALAPNSPKTFLNQVERWILYYHHHYADSGILAFLRLPWLLPLLPLLLPTVAALPVVAEHPVRTSLIRFPILIIHWIFASAFALEPPTGSSLERSSPIIFLDRECHPKGKGSWNLLIP